MTVTRTDTPGASGSASAADSADAGEPTPEIVLPADAPRRTPIEIIVLVLAAAAIGIGFRFIARTPLWLDEALSVNIAKLSPGEINEALRHDGHPPLYYYLLHFWMQIFGSSDVAVRALSGVISVVTLPVAWFAGRRRGGPLLGWVMVGVLALSTFAVRYASETRMYSLLILLVFAGYVLLDGAVRSEKATWWRWIGLAVISGLLMLTHYWSMFLLGAIGVVLLWRFWRTRNRQVRNTLIAMVVGAVVLFLPWLSTFRFQSAHTGTPWATAFRPTTTVAVTFESFHSIAGDFRDPLIALMASTLLFGLGLFGVARSRRKIEIELGTVPQVRYDAIVLALTLGFGIVAGLLTKSAYATRYASVLFPLFIIVVAAGVTRFVSRPIRFGVLAVYLALSTMGVLNAALVNQRTQVKVAADEVAAVSKPGDLVVYCPDQLGPAGSRVMPADVRQISYPTLGPADLAPGDTSAVERVDWLDYADRNTAANPEQLADRTLAMAGPEHSIFVLFNTQYRTFEGQCERYMHALSLKRPGVADLVTMDPEKYFEHENLKQFKPTTP